MAEALGVKINAAGARPDIGPGLPTKSGGEYAWVGINLPLGKSWFFELASYFEVSETTADHNDLYVYGAVRLPGTHDPDTLCRAIIVSHPWIIESNKEERSVELFPGKPLVDLSEYSVHLERVIGEWCRIWSSLGGFGGMAHKSGTSK
jgi:hypothetical protein